MNQRTEEFRVTGEELLKTVKKIIKAGNARRIIIKRETGRTVIEIPLTVGAVAALLTRCTIVVVRNE